MNRSLPVVVCFAGHDPVGGAGIQADIEAIARFGCHACSIVTALTVQDSRNVTRVIPQAAEDFLEQAMVLLGDVSASAIKIGLLGSAAIARAVAELIRKNSHAPVVLDPILAAGGGRTLSNSDLLEIIRSELVPRALIVTPNTPEIQALAGFQDIDQAAANLLTAGCPNVLLTGTHDSTPDVINRWYQATGTTQTYRWPRLPASYHGSGCTLAAALAGAIAAGSPLDTAIQSAQEFTWKSLRQGLTLGKGQLIPNRTHRFDPE